MASPARAEKRRAARNDPPTNGEVIEGTASEIRPPEPQEGEEQVSGVFIRVTGTGKYQVEIQPLGDTRLTECQTLLELALKRVKELVRLDD